MLWKHGRHWILSEKYSSLYIYFIKTRIKNNKIFDSSMWGGRLREALWIIG